MAPGLDGLPAAERDIDVSSPVAEFLRSVSPRALARIKLGLRTFEWLPFPWRFSRLDAPAREDFLRGMETSRTVTRWRPNGFGRCGDRVANTPAGGTEVSPRG